MVKRLASYVPTPGEQICIIITTRYLSLEVLVPLHSPVTVENMYAHPNILILEVVNHMAYYISGKSCASAKIFVECEVVQDSATKGPPLRPDWYAAFLLDVVLSDDLQKNAFECRLFHRIFREVTLSRK